VIVFHRDAVLTAGSIHQVAPADSARWQDFVHDAHRLAAIITEINRRPPPSLDGPAAHEWWHLLGHGRRLRALGARDLARLARWVPMPIADLVGECFDHELLRAAVASRALFGNFAGPRSAGTGAMFLQRLAEDPVPVGGGATVRGGPGALTQALAELARRAGATLTTGARVTRLLVRQGRVTGVALESGAEIAAQAVVSAVDPRQTFLNLTDPADLPPSFLERVRHYRARGVTAKINLALSDLPVFRALGGDAVPLRGRLLIAPGLDYLERAFDAAKYGEVSEHPWLELSVPSVTDPTLAPAGQHVLSVVAHFAPFDLRGRSWADAREPLYQSVMRVLVEHAPDLDRLVTARQVITPEDLERVWGLSGGHIFHGELALDQLWVARPLLGWAQYRTPLPGLYLAGAGTHPGGGLTGLPGLLAAGEVERDLRRRGRPSR
jgi:phytoene dehydrogenase-like protein